MEAMEDRLALIREKVEKLLQENARLKMENDRLSAERSDFQKTIDLQKNALAEAAETNKMIKLAKNLSLSGSDSFDVKIKINEMVKEIDRCIDLLNE
jgi:regulator of replication initiation timing